MIILLDNLKNWLDTSIKKNEIKILFRCFKMFTWFTIWKDWTNSIATECQVSDRRSGHEPTIDLKWRKGLNIKIIITCIHFIFINTNTNQYTNNIMKIEIQYFFVKVKRVFFFEMIFIVVLISISVQHVLQECFAHMKSFQL